MTRPTILVISQHPELKKGLDLTPYSQMPFPKAEKLRLLRYPRCRREMFGICNSRQFSAGYKTHLLGVYIAEVINGDITESAQRMNIIKSFSEKPGFEVLVLAPRSLVGLNITAANHVIHYGRDWNPAIENQATDRAYRLSNA